MSMLSASHAGQFVKHVLPAIIRPLRVMWNQIIGFFFVVIAVWAVPRAVRSVHEFDGGAPALFRLVLSGLFVAMMAGFGLYSFWRAHKVPKAR